MVPGVTNATVTLSFLLSGINLSFGGVAVSVCVMAFKGTQIHLLGRRSPPLTCSRWLSSI